MSWLSRMANVFRSSRVDRTLDDEAAFHLECRINELVATGVSAGEAEAQARRAFGHRLQIRERSRDVKLLPWLAESVQDLRFGVRTIRRAPVFSAVAVATLALGIGANGTIFSVLNAVLLQPLPYPHPERLVYLETEYGPGEDSPASVAEYLEFRAFNQSFAAVGAFRAAEANLATGDRAFRVRSASVDAPLLNALQIDPAQGRRFTDADTTLNAPAVTLISHELWQTAFGARPIVGQTIDVDGRQAVVIGVMPPGVDLLDTRTDVWLPLAFTENDRISRNNHNVFVIGRLKAGVTLAGAERELASLVGTWAQRAGVTPGGEGHAGHVFLPAGANGAAHSPVMTPLADQVLGSAGQAIWMLQALVALVLLIACANVANLTLSRALTRRREFTVMAALGAGAGRLIRKVLIENAILAAIGGLLGLVLAYGGVTALTRWAPAGLPRIHQVTVDGSVIVVSLLVALACGVVFGLPPLMQARSRSAADALKSGLRASGSGTPPRVRGALVVAETALAVVVLAGAALLMRTVHNLTVVDPGFDRTRLVTFSISLPARTFPNLPRLRAYQGIVERLRAVPGVDAASAMSALPLDRPQRVSQTEITNNPDGGPIPIDYQRVMSGFFQATGVAIVQGRGFERADERSQAHVAIVNETMAKTYWSGQNPIGQRLRPGGTTPWLTVVGVARDVKQTGVNQPIRPEAYVLVDQVVVESLTSTLSLAPLTMHMMVRTALPVAALAPAIREAVRATAPTVPVAKLRSMDDVFADSIRRSRFVAQLLTVFAALALLLAAIGTYGALASIVAERQRELGIRLALGAKRARLLGEVIGRGVTLAGVGAAVGLIAAFGLSRFVRSLLFGVQPIDPISLAIVIGSILSVAAVAATLPAWRASRLDPNLVLRTD